MGARMRLGWFLSIAPACTPSAPPRSAAEVHRSDEAPSEPPQVIVPAEPRTSEREATLEDAPSTTIHGVTLAPRSQLVTASGPPGHVWFEIRNAGAPASVRVVALELGGVAVPITSTRLDDVAQPGSAITIASGTHVLDFMIDDAQLSAAAEAYTFVLRLQVAGSEVSAQTTVLRARREPMRH